MQHRSIVTVLAFLALSGAFPLVAGEQGESFTPDFTLEYVATSTGTTFAVASGIFAYHPECLTSWVATSPVVTSTTDMVRKQTYRVRLVPAVIEERVQSGGSVTSSLLTCPAGAAIVANVIQQPEFLSFDNGCENVNEYVTSASNPRGVSPHAGVEFASETSKPLWNRINTCARTFVGSSTADVPFSGTVVTRYWGERFGFDGYGRACSPLMLGGFTIQLADPNCPFKQRPSNFQFTYRWHSETDSLHGRATGPTDWDGDRLGVGSWGGSWETTSFCVSPGPCS